MFPPATPPTLKIIPAYPYAEYSDDSDIQAFFTSYNQFAQVYFDWLNVINLPVYTGPLIVGALLDWVAQGVYGISRPALAFTQTRSVGPFNTYVLNSLAFNASRSTSTSTLYVVTDDVFKRVITWNFFKGDGKVFNIRWLKRRVMRFLGGLNGVNFNIDQTYQVSVTFTAAQEITIDISVGTAPLTDKAIFIAAVKAGVLDLPFQFTYVVT